MEANRALVMHVQKLADERKCNPVANRLGLGVGSGRRHRSHSGPKKIKYFEQNVGAGDVLLNATEIAHQILISPAAATDPVNGSGPPRQMRAVRVIVRYRFSNMR